MSARGDHPRRGKPAPSSRYPNHIRLNVRHQRWLAEIEQLNAARGMPPLPPHELIERALEAHARQLADENLEASLERMRRLSHSITVKKDPGGEGYKVFRHGAYIGQATPDDDGEIANFTPFHRGFDVHAYTDNEKADLIDQVKALVNEEKVDPETAEPELRGESK